MAIFAHEGENTSLAGPVPAGAESPKIRDVLGDVLHPLATARYQSPLRYPGAKSGLSKVIGELIANAQRSSRVGRTELLVEPFAGGASTSLRLLGSGIVKRALLADADPMVASFWQVAASRTEELVERISEEYNKYIAVGGRKALERWDYWRNRPELLGASHKVIDLELATKCLFLNRTTFSGILHGGAGPIGGRAQNSAYGIGCRFNLQELVDRLRYVGCLYDTGRIVDVCCSDWEATLRSVAVLYKSWLPNRVVAYLDPPYLSKSGKLYRRSQDLRGASTGMDLDWVEGMQHYRLAKYLRQEMQSRWILSYDRDQRLLAESSLYSTKMMAEPRCKHRELNVKRWFISKRVVVLNYTASSRLGRGKKEELLLTTLPPSRVPTHERLMPAN